MILQVNNLDSYFLLLYFVNVNYKGCQDVVYDSFYLSICRLMIKQSGLWSGVIMTIGWSLVMMGAQ